MHTKRTVRTGSRAKSVAWTLTALRGATAALALSLGGCAGTSMTNMWADASFTARPIRNVLVVVVRRDAVRRRVWEDAFVNELRARGTSATASYTLFGAVPDTQQVVRAVSEHHYDAVLASLRLPPSLETQVVPGYLRKEPLTRYNPWTNTYQTYYHDVMTPDRVDTTLVQHFRTDVWAIGADGRLVWSGTLNVSEGPSPETIRKNVSKHIMPELEAVGLVRKRG